MAHTLVVKMTSNIIKRSFRINLLIMRLFYFYPSADSSYLYTIRAYVIYVLLIMPVPILGILYLLLEDELDLDKVNYNAGFLAQATSFIFKFLPFVTQSRRIRQCIQYFEVFSFAVDRDNHKEIIEKCIRGCRRNSLIFLLIAIAGAGGWVTKPLFWKGRQLPVDIWLPFDPSRSLITYCCTYLCTITGPFISTLITGVIDPLIAGLVDHARTQITVLKDDLENLSVYANNTDRGTIYERIKRSVQHYDAILRFTKEFEACFSLVMFSQMLASIFVLCFCCLQLIQIHTLGYYFMQLVAYIAVILGQICFYCYYGNKLSEEADSLTNAIYMSAWYDYDTKSKKALLTIMERSKKPVIITSGKIVQLSLMTFVTILKRSYSLLAVLKNYS